MPKKPNTIPLPFPSDAPNIERFWSQVDRSSSCWEWTGRRNEHGYGVAYWKLRQPLAHRLAWVLTNGPIPEGMHILHRCDNPPCCNPAHLFPGTASENVLDAVSKGRWGTRAVQGSQQPGSKLTEADIPIIRQMRSDGQTFRAIAESFNVSPRTITFIIRGKKWKHVA